MTITLALSSFSLKDFRVYMESVRTFQFAKELTYKTLLFWFAYNFCRWNEVVVLLCHKHINSFNTLWRICIDATQVYTNIWCAWHLFLRIFLTIISNEMLSSLWVLWMHWSTLKNIDFVWLTILQMWASFNLFIKQIHVVFESSLQSYRIILVSKYIPFNTNPLNDRFVYFKVDLTIILRKAPIPNVNKPHATASINIWTVGKT